MAADVEERTDAIGIFANDNNLFIANAEQEIITLVRNSRNMASEQPFAADDLIEVGFEHRIAGVKFLIKTIPHPRVRGEAAHKFGVRHQIFIRVFVGSYMGLIEAVTG